MARHTENLKEIIHFYNQVLGFDILGLFENHDNYNGVFLGMKNETWQLEFTSSDEKPKHQPDDDDLIDFYTAAEHPFNEIISALKNENIDPIKSKNPYWDKNGITILAPENFREVIAKPTK